MVLAHPPGFDGKQRGRGGIQGMPVSVSVSPPEGTHHGDVDVARGGDLVPALRVPLGHHPGARLGGLPALHPLRVLHRPEPEGRRRVSFTPLQRMVQTGLELYNNEEDNKRGESPLGELWIKTELEGVCEGGIVNLKGMAWGEIVFPLTLIQRREEQYR